jgi:hypothetical protein
MTPDHGSWDASELILWQCKKMREMQLRFPFGQASYKKMLDSCSVLIV